MLPFFASDRNAVPRGLPCPAFLYATGFTASRLGKASEYAPPHGTPAWACSLEPQRHDAGHAVHTLVGVVRSVHRVRIRGIDRGGRLFRFDLDLFQALPCRLPLYIHESVVQGGPVRRGDLLAATALLYADLFSPETGDFEAWLDAHPDGPGPEPDYVGPPRGGVLEEFDREPESAGKHGGDVNGEDGEDDRSKRLTPETMDVIRVALHKLLSLPGCADCRVWPDNPTAAQIACRVGGEVRRFRVFRRMGDEPSPAPDDTPPGVSPLVVRIIPDRKVYRVVYEGFPEAVP